jgi:hypothetical protein
MFFWVSPRRQIKFCRRFATLCQVHLQRHDVAYEFKLLTARRLYKSFGVKGLSDIMLRKNLSYLLTHLLTYILTHSLTPHSTVLLKKPTNLQPVKKFPAFYGTRRFITAFTSARHPFLSSASSFQSIPHIPLPEDPP